MKKIYFIIPISLLVALAFYLYTNHQLRVTSDSTDSKLPLESAQTVQDETELTIAASVGTRTVNSQNVVYVNFPNPTDEKTKALLDILKLQKNNIGKVTFHIGALKDGKIDSLASMTKETQSKILTAMKTGAEIELELTFPPPIRDAMGVSVNYTDACSISAQFDLAAVERKKLLTENRHGEYNASCIQSSGDEELVATQFHLGHMSYNPSDQLTPIGNLRLHGHIEKGAMQAWDQRYDTVEFVLTDEPRDDAEKSFYDYYAIEAFDTHFLSLAVGTESDGTIHPLLPISDEVVALFQKMMNKDGKVAVRVKYLRPDVNAVVITELDAFALPQIPPPPLQKPDIDFTR